MSREPHAARRLSIADTESLEESRTTISRIFKLVPSLTVVLIYSTFLAGRLSVKIQISLKTSTSWTLKDPEIQKAVRTADVQDLKSALKLEAATQASHRDHYSIRGTRETENASCEFRFGLIYYPGSVLK
ncbi:hypothetical protein TNCV_4885401 [Trichonephila clavipes]|nr:hypothetical protein TNCV_4885401 [Trichonephila clavipes]